MERPIDQILFVPDLNPEIRFSKYVSGNDTLESDAQTHRMTIPLFKRSYEDINGRIKHTSSRSRWECPSIEHLIDFLERGDADPSLPLGISGISRIRNELKDYPFLIEPAFSDPIMIKKRRGPHGYEIEKSFVYITFRKKEDREFFYPKTKMDALSLNPWWKATKGNKGERLVIGVLHTFRDLDKNKRES